MTPVQVDRLNIGLLALSLTLAFALPFELFLFSYAVLGPLHYLTELAWLHKRDFFSNGKRDWWWLAAIVVLAFLSAQFVIGSLAVRSLFPYSQIFAFLAFTMAFVFAVVRDSSLRIALAVLVPVVTLSVVNVSAREWMLFSLFTTTILHVSLFTGAFMLYGALKARSTSGYLVVALFAVGCAIALFAPAGPGAGVSTYVSDSYQLFRGLNHELARVFSLGNAVGVDGSSGFARPADLFTSPGGIRIQRLIAFAYTYHYLNWFSKTSIIGWIKVDKRKLVAAVVIWIASLALYAKSYELGARWLFALSYAHVLLEFPLNHRSFVGIGQELYGRFARRGSRAQA